MNYKFLDFSINKNIFQEKLDVPGAFLLHNLLTNKECQRIIDHSEGIGYTMAKINNGAGKMVKRTQSRNSKRLILDVPEHSLHSLWSKLKDYLPETIVSGVRYHPTGLNPRLRMLRYHPGEYFAKHYDAGHNGSLMTLIVYLSDSFKGGETRFYKGSREIDSVTPKRGSALLFFHDRHPLSPLHEGCPVKNGCKYAMRTDVYYST